MPIDHDKLQYWIERSRTTIYSETDVRNFHHELTDRVISDFIAPLNLPPDTRILDVGCGPGWFLYKMRDRGYTDLQGVTLSREDVEVCERRQLNVTLQDMSFLEYPDRCFDFIFCRHALEHSPFPLFTLFEFERIIRPGGRVYVEVPAPGCERQHEMNPNHYSVLGHQMWSSLFNKAGFKVDDARELSATVNLASGPVLEVALCYTLSHLTT